MADEASLQKLKNAANYMAKGTADGLSSIYAAVPAINAEEVRGRIMAAVGAVGGNTLTAAYQAANQCGTITSRLTSTVYGTAVGGAGGSSDGGFGGYFNDDFYKKVGKGTLYTAAGCVAVLGGTALVVPLLGFTSVGVGAGTSAAAYQAAYLGGTIAAGGKFALLQSVGAAGLAASTKVAVGGIIAVPAFTAAFREDKLKSKL